MCMYIYICWRSRTCNTGRAQRQRLLSARSREAIQHGPDGVFRVSGDVVSLPRERRVRKRDRAALGREGDHVTRFTGVRRILSNNVSQMCVMSKCMILGETATIKDANRPTYKSSCRPDLLTSRARQRAPPSPGNDCSW